MLPWEPLAEFHQRAAQRVPRQSTGRRLTMLVLPQVLDTVMSAGIPIAGVVGGGYHADLQVLAQRHTWLHRAAAQMWTDHAL